MASVLGLPLLLVVENNGYAEMTPADALTAVPAHERAAAYGMQAKWWTATTRPRSPRRSGRPHVLRDGGAALSRHDAPTGRALLRGRAGLPARPVSWRRRGSRPARPAGRAAQRDDEG